MKILFITDNFPPESNAPAIRTHEHTRRWVQMGHDVTVITCVPNFPKGVIFPGYKNRLMQREEIDGVKVIRVWTYISANEGTLRRLVDFISFMFSAIIASFKVSRPDALIATSPQFFTAIAGWIISSIKRCPFVFELRDLWPESIVAVDAMKDNAALHLLDRFSHFLYRRADLVIPVTREYSKRLQECGVPDSRIRLITNGIDVRSIQITKSREEIRREYGIPEDSFVAGFIGTIGMAQNVSTIVSAAIRSKENKKIRYLIMGEGAGRSAIETLIEKHQPDNVILIHGKPRHEALEILNACDVSLVLLKDSALFETVIPSKIFEAMALSKPILLGVRGESHRIVIDEGHCGEAFPPEDPVALVEALSGLEGDRERCEKLGRNGRSLVEGNYQRTDLADRMISEIEGRFARPKDLSRESILIVTNHFWPEEFRINDLALGLQEKGHEISVLTGIPNYPAGRFFEGYGIFKKRREGFEGIEVFRAPLIPRGGGSEFRLFINYVSYAFSACVLAPFVLRKNYDLIIVYETSPVTVGLPALVMKKLRGIPIIFWVQDIWPDSLSATGVVKSERLLRWVGLLVRFIYNRCDRILISSKTFSESVERLAPSPERILYFPNSAEEFYRPVQLEPSAPERAQMPDGFRILFAGNIGVAQDFGTILAAAEILKEHPDIHWVIIGDGRQRSWVESEVKKRGLEGVVHLLGRHPAETMPRYFSLADALLVTLKREPNFALTVPSKVQSYIACGRPVIAGLDGEGARVVDEAGAGLTCPAESPELLAKATLDMYGLSEAERLAMGDRGRKYFEREFERNMLLGRLDGMIREVTVEASR